MASIISSVPIARTGGVWCAHVFGCDALEVGAHADVFAKVFEGEDLPGCIDGSVNACVFGDLDHLIEGNDVGVFGCLLDYWDVDGAGLVGDGGPDVVFVRAVLITGVDEFRSG